MHYYKIYVCYGGQEGYTVGFESAEDFGDEDSIVDEAIGLGKLSADDEKYVATAEQIDKAEFHAIC